MSMDSISDEAMAAANNNSSRATSATGHSHADVKGKRTKRQTLHQLPPPLAGPASPTSSSGEFSGSTTEEEEDMANCLILLAQGRALEAGPKSEAVQVEEELAGGVGGGGERYTSRRLAEAATTTNGKVGFYVYECKTCNKCFPSFQALGGHRASHKRPRTALVAALAMEEKKAIQEDALQISIATYPDRDILPNSSGGSAVATTPNPNGNSTTANNNRPRVHECSICGSEFSSGQALGGHMRRHRTAVTPPEPQVVTRKEKNLPSLDLNLPAPLDDDRGDLFAGKQPLVFSAPALVGCHY